MCCHAEGTAFEDLTLPDRRPPTGLAAGLLSVTLLIQQRRLRELDVAPQFGELCRQGGVFPGGFLLHFHLVVKPTRGGSDGTSGATQ